VNVNNDLKSALQATLEEMFFLEVAEPKFFWARVMVREPFSGAVTLVFPRPLLETVAAGLMPDQEALDERTLGDILAELVNTVAGRLVSLVVDESTTFKLDVPDVGTGWPQSGLCPAAIQPYEIEGRLFMVLLEGEELV
jgi:hypothetical protein